MSVSSSGESVSRTSSEEDLFDAEDDDTEPVLEVRGAEPYRYEPVVDVAAQRENADADRVAVGAHAGQQNRLGNSEWCQCGRCTPQNELANCRCCHEYPQMMAKLAEENLTSIQCLTDHPWFEATCLNPGTLQTAYYGYRQQYGAAAIEGGRDRKFRHVAYRQLVRWCWGFLGRHNRIPLPSCVMQVVHDTYPSPDGEYRGFRYPPLEEL